MTTDTVVTQEEAKKSSNIAMAGVCLLAEGKLWNDSSKYLSEKKQHISPMKHFSIQTLAKSSAGSSFFGVFGQESLSHGI